ncbi:MAG: glycoside hydrolase family 25 protein [Oscillospiraceae bacterium]|nr:glycoside hydrolase family 25 protein [Oscillospiraceae bacterium]
MKGKIHICAALLCALLLSACAPAHVPTPTETIPPNRYSPENFIYQDGYLECITADAVMGIDVSRYQENIDWQQVKAAGVEFVMVRLGNRGIAEGTLHEDPYARQNLQGAREAGLKVGAYFYSQALNVEEAQEEAALALEILDGFQLDMPLAFDWEQESRTENVDARTLTDSTLAFCGAVETAGYKPMIYFNSFQAKQLLHLRELKDIPWWLAMYDVTMEFPYRMDMWQYSCTGTVPGIDGSVDLNLLFEDGMI